MRHICAGDGRKRDLAGMNRSTRITVQLNVDELAKVDEIRGALSRPAFVRMLLRAAGPTGGGDVAQHTEALAILTALARDGKMPAAIALERALRGADGAPADDAFAAYDEMAGRRASRG